MKGNLKLQFKFKFRQRFQPTQESSIKSDITLVGNLAKGYVGTQKGIARSPLPQKYGNLPLPSYWGNLYGNFARFYYQKLPTFVLKLLP